MAKYPRQLSASIAEDLYDRIETERIARENASQSDVTRDAAGIGMAALEWARSQGVSPEELVLCLTQPSAWAAAVSTGRSRIAAAIG